MNYEYNDSVRILHCLLMQASAMQDKGLLHGQIGIVLALAECYRETSMVIYEDLMEELLDVLVENVPRRSECSFSDGLCGIGWGLEFLLQGSWIEGNGLELCAEIDEVLMKENLRRLSDWSLATGLEGMLHYVLAHLQGCWRQFGKLPFDTEFYQDLYVVVSRAKIQSGIPETLKLLINSFVSFFQSGIPPYYEFDLLSLIQPESVDVDVLQCPLGLSDGLAGKLLLFHKGRKEIDV